MIVALFVSASQFSVSGDFTGFVRTGSRVVINMGDDGMLETSVTATSYMPGSDITLYTTKSSAITENITEILRSHTFVDPDAQSSNLSEHDHTAEYQGGLCAFSALDDTAKVALLNAIAAISVLSSDKILSVNTAGDAFLKRSLASTTGHITVTITEGAYTLALPQTIRTTDVPEFAGLKLTAFNGVAIADALTGLLVSMNTDTAKAVFRKNSANNGYQFAVPSIFDNTDVAESAPENGQGLYWDSILGKFRVRTGEGGGPAPEGVSLGVVVALIDFFT
jgi:hypothetical protein